MIRGKEKEKGEIFGERGKIIIEKEIIKFTRVEEKEEGKEQEANEVEVGEKEREEVEKETGKEAEEERREEE